MMDNQAGAISLERPDGGWGWVVVGAVFVSMSLTRGVSLAYPLFYLPLMQEFDIGLSEVTWLTGLYEFGKAFGYVMTAAVLSKFGHRRTGISISIISGVSLSLASWSPSPLLVYILAGLIPGAVMAVFGTMFNVIIPRYFNKRRFLAIGISSIGSPVGTLAFAPLLQYLIEQYGWHGGMLLLGGMTFNCAVASALYRPMRLRINNEKPARTNQALQNSAKEIAKLPGFWLLCVIWMLVFSGWTAHLRFLVPYAQEVLDVEPMRSSLLLSLYSIVSIVRLGYGGLGDRKDVNVVWVLIVTLLVTAVASSSVWFVTSYVGLVINTVVHSFVSSGIHVLYISVIIQVVGEDNMTWVFTIMGFTYAVLGAAVVPLIGMLVDSSGEIRVAYLISGGIMTVAALLHIPLIHPRKDNANK